MAWERGMTERGKAAGEGRIRKRGHGQKREGKLQGKADNRRSATPTVKFRLRLYNAYALYSVCRGFGTLNEEVVSADHLFIR